MRAERLTIALLLALVASRVSAQDAPPEPPPCAEGRERMDGVCCWPGQTFDHEQHACVGAPRCPAPLVEHGESCVGTAATIAQLPIGEISVPPEYFVPPTATPTAPRVQHLAVSTAQWPAAHEGSLSRPARQDGEDGGLVAASLVVFDIGWILGILTAALDEAAHDCGGFGFPRATASTSCNSWPMFFIPVGGGIASGMMDFNSLSRTSWGWGFATGIPSILLQGIGLIMLAGVLGNNQTHGWGYVPIGTSASLSILPGAAATDIGATFALHL